MINAIELRKGMVIKLNNSYYRVEMTKHVTPGKGQALIQTKIRDLSDMTIRDHRFRPVDKVEKAVVENREYMFSYTDNDQYVFLHSDTYEELRLSGEIIDDVRNYLVENRSYTIEFIEGKPVNVIPPLAMDFTVEETEASIKGATVQASYKPATLENGLEITVPQFINMGDQVRVDTRTGEYMERIKKN